MNQHGRQSPTDKARTLCRVPEAHTDSGRLYAGRKLREVSEA